MSEKMKIWVALLISSSALVADDVVFATKDDLAAFDKLIEQSRERMHKDLVKGEGTTEEKLVLHPSSVGSIVSQEAKKLRESESMKSVTRSVGDKRIKNRKGRDPRLDRTIVREKSSPTKHTPPEKMRAIIK